MNLNVLRSYLVSLGWQIDTSGMAKFKAALKDADRVVEDHVGHVGKLFLGMGAGIAAAYGAVSAATIGLMDHVAQADLGFQLYAMKMYMGVNAAKSLKIATDALGYSLDEIAWNPELHGRLLELLGDQAKMQRGLGPDYEKNLREIRDIRFEFTRMGVEFQYLLMGVVKNLAKAFGLDEGGLLRKLRDFNEYVQNNLPAISRTIANDLVPVMRDVKTLAEDIGLAFLHFIGTLYNDKKLQQSKGGLEDVATAIKHISDSVDQALQKIDTFTKWIDAHPRIAAILFGAATGAAAGGFVAGPVGAMIGGFAGAAAMDSAAVRSHMSQGELSAEEWRQVQGRDEQANILRRFGNFTGLFNRSMRHEGRDKAIRAIIEAAQPFGIADLALAVAKAESGINPYVHPSKAGAIGVMQLMPGTAKGLGVNPNNPGENIAGGVALLARLMAKYHDVSKALAAYNWGESHIPVNGPMPKLPKETSDYVAKVEREMARIDVGGIHIYGADKMTAEQIARAVMAQLDEKAGKQTQRNIAQLQSSWSY